MTPKASADANSAQSPVAALSSLVAGTTRQMFSLSLLLALQYYVGKSLVALKISFPAPLAAMLLVLGVVSIFRLLRLSKFIDRVIATCFTPAVSLLSRWLAVFFVPNLVMLPLAPPLPSSDVSKLAVFIPSAFVLTLLSTVAFCCLLQRLQARGGAASMSAPSVESRASQSSAPSNALIATLSSVLAVTMFMCVRNPSVNNPVARLYALAATLLTFCVGQRFDSRVKSVLHPLVVCTLGTIGAMQLLGLATGASFATSLSAYYASSTSPLSGAGNLLTALLGPAVITFAFTMDRHRRLAITRNIEVVGASLFGAVASLIGTAGIARAMRMSPDSRLLLLPRTVTAPLAVPIAGLIGADVRVAASIVALTGLIGANVGRAILTKAGVKDPVVRGLAIGTAAHGLGTAAMNDEKDALPFAALAMTLVGVFSTILVAYAPFRVFLLRVAMGKKVI